jgi:UDP-glucose 4-epimerase
MAILITGGTGFIGLHTAKALLDAGHDVVATQFRVRRDPSFVRDQLGNRLQREVMDISSPYALHDAMRKHEIEGIIHLAVPGVGALSPSEDFRSNMMSLLNILEAAQNFGVPRVVIASSLAVYGSSPGGVHREDDRLDVNSQNATSAYKKSQEIIGLHYADRAKMDVIFARIGVIYGPLYHSMVNTPSRIVHRAVRPDSKVAIDTISAGERHDYCYVKDCATGLMLLQTSKTLKDRIYNVGSGTTTVHAEIADAARAAVPGAVLQLSSEPPKDMRSSQAALDITAISRDTGYAPAWDIRRGIADYAEWLRTNDF